MALDAPVLEQLSGLTYDDGDKKGIPITDHPFVKEAPDLKTLVKGGFDAHREVGARVRLPDPKTAKPEDMQAFTKTLIEKGILPTPLAKPEDYGIVRPADLPKDMAWNDEAAKELATILHKNGAPKGLAAELIALQTKLAMGHQHALKTSMEEGTKALKAEYGDKYDERTDQAGRLASMIFKTDEELKFFNDLGLGNDPRFLRVLMRLGPLAAQDSAFMAEAQGSGASSGDAVQQKWAAIMTDKTNPKYAAFWKNDPALLRERMEDFKKAYGDKQVNISSGIEVVGKPNP